MLFVNHHFHYTYIFNFLFFPGTKYCSSSNTSSVFWSVTSFSSILEEFHDLAFDKISPRALLKSRSDILT